MGGRSISDVELDAIKQTDPTRHHDIMRCRAYRENHREEMRVRAAAERAKNPDYYRKYYRLKKQEQRAKEKEAEQSGPFTPREIKSMRKWDEKIDKEESKKRADYAKRQRQNKKARADTQADANGTNKIITNEMEESKNEV